MSESVIGVFEELSKAREAERSLNAISIPCEIYDRATFDSDAHEGGTFGYFSHLLGAEDVSADRYFKAFKQGFFIVANAQKQYRGGIRSQIAATIRRPECPDSPLLGAAL